jgi:hypothetical protein
MLRALLGSRDGTGSDGGALAMEPVLERCGLDLTGPGFGFGPASGPRRACVARALEPARSAGARRTYMMTPSYPYGRPGRDWPNLLGLAEALAGEDAGAPLLELRVLVLRRDPWSLDLAHFLGSLHGAPHNVRANRPGDTFGAAALVDTALSVLSAEISALPRKCTAASASSVGVRYRILDYGAFVAEPASRAEALAQFAGVDLSLVEGRISSGAVKASGRTVCNGAPEDWLLFSAMEMRKFGNIFADPECLLGGK